MQQAEPKWVSRGALLAVAGAYAACYEIGRSCGGLQWNMMAGMRMTALLLLPRRFWPALLMGEWVPVLVTAFLCSTTLGLDWSLLMGIPVIGACIPVLALASRTGGLYRADGDLNVPWLISVASVCALLNAALIYAPVVAAIAASPGRWPSIHPGDYFLAYLMGAYLAMLTIPMSILASKAVFASIRLGVWKRICRAPLGGGLIAVCLVWWITLAMSARGGHDMPYQELRLGAALPVVPLVFRFGWRGGAFSGLVAAVLLASTGGSDLDMSLVHAQIALALVMSGAILVADLATRRRQTIAIHRDRELDNPTSR